MYKRQVDGTVVTVDQRCCCLNVLCRGQSEKPDITPRSSWKREGSGGGGVRLNIMNWLDSLLLSTCTGNLINNDLAEMSTIESHTEICITSLTTDTGSSVC